MTEQINPGDIRRRLVEIDDELRALAADDFEAKYRLNTEADLLRQQLASMTRDSDGELLDEWSDRAARKGSHTSDNETDQGAARIVSPMDSGGSV